MKKLLLMVFTCLFISGCGESINGDQVTGKWEIDQSLTHDQVTRMSGRLPDNMKVLMRMEGEQIFAEDGKYEWSATVTMNIFVNNYRTTLVFDMEDKGIWDIEGNILTETIQSSDAIPANDATEEFTDENPEFLQGLGAKPGEMRASEVSIEGTTMKLKDQQSKTVIILKRM